MFENNGCAPTPTQPAGARPGSQASIMDYPNHSQLRGKLCSPLGSFPSLRTGAIDFDSDAPSPLEGPHPALAAVTPSSLLICSSDSPFSLTPTLTIQMFHHLIPSKVPSPFVSSCTESKPRGSCNETPALEITTNQTINSPLLGAG